VCQRPSSQWRPAPFFSSPLQTSRSQCVGVAAAAFAVVASLVETPANGRLPSETTSRATSQQLELLLSTSKVHVIASYAVQVPQPYNGKVALSAVKVRVTRCGYLRCGGVVVVFVVVVFTVFRWQPHSALGSSSCCWGPTVWAPSCIFRRR